MKKIPQRTCIGCKAKKDKKELIRIVKNKEGEITIDRTGKMQGRGTYICDDITCLERAIKTKSLERSFESPIDEGVYENLRGVMIDNKK